MKTSVAQYCYLDLYVSILDKEKDSFIDRFGQLDHFRRYRLDIMIKNLSDGIVHHSTFIPIIESYQEVIC